LFSEGGNWALTLDIACWCSPAGRAGEAAGCPGRGRRAAGRSLCPAAGRGRGGVAPSDRVIARPYVREPRRLARLLASCDAFVHANDAEPFGLVVLEAMACGLPVVGVASGGVAESVDEAVGQLAARSDGPALAEAIDTLFGRDPAAIGRAARLRARTRHGWDRVFAQLTALYARLTGEAAFITPATAAR